MGWERWLFDGIIIFFLITMGAAILEAFDRSRRSERYGWHVFIFFAAIAWIIVFYGSFIEPKIIVAREYDIDLRKNNKPGQALQIAVLSDFHLGPYNDRLLVEHVVSRLHKIDPDIVFILGDNVSYHNGSVYDFGPLVNIKPTYGVYGVTGNHDYLGDDVEEVVSALEAYGVRFLRNTSASIRSNGRTVQVAGVDDYWYGDMNITSALEGTWENNLVLFLAHNPDVVKYVPEDLYFDLMISGHTHGGQIRLPWIGSVVQPPFDLSREYSQGFGEYGGRKMFVSSGLGEVGPRARLFNPPEISILNITY